MHLQCRRYSLKAPLNYALSFWRIVRLGGKLLKIYAIIEYTFLETR